MDLYGRSWPADYTQFDIEKEIIRAGGKITFDGVEYGRGLKYHFGLFQRLLFPDRIVRVKDIWNHWTTIMTEIWLEHTYIGVMGCAASGKSHNFAANALADWYCFPEKTTTLLSSTTMKLLKLRIWANVVAFHLKAKQLWPSCPGHLIAGDLMIVHKPDEYESGADFRNGIVGLACKQGSEWVGLGSYVGIHNERVRVIFDEAHLMPRAVIDSTSNLSKCPDFKCAALGNPNETTNAHGTLCEPAPHLGGWEGGLDQKPGTRVWTTKFPNGIALKCPGSDSPNLQVPPGKRVPFPYIMTRRQMEDDAKIWGTDDWHFLMMNEACMPRGQGSRRIITRQFCLKHGAMNEPMWLGTGREKIGFLDAAYGGVGGDRCVFGEMQFGFEADRPATPKLSDAMLGLPTPPTRRHLLALIDLVICPVKAEEGASPPEEQIANWCRDECAKRNIDANAFFYDAGFRSSLVTAFARLWSPAVNAIDCGGRPTDRIVGGNVNKPASEVYFNFVTELWWRWRLVIECGQFRGLTEAAMIEGSQREWLTVRGNKIQIEPKEELKKKTGRSPDLADAITIGIEGAFRRGFQLTQSVATQTAEKDFGWLRDLSRKQADFRRETEMELVS